jgi:hypothetical protein
MYIPFFVFFPLFCYVFFPFFFVFKGGDAGCVICKSSKGLIIATYKGGKQPGSAVNVTEKLCDYLVSVGY